MAYADCRSSGCGFESRRPRLNGPLTAIVSGPFPLIGEALAMRDDPCRKSGDGRVDDWRATVAAERPLGQG